MDTLLRFAMLEFEPDYSDLPDLEHDWTKSVYEEITEIRPHDAPELLGKYVTITHFVDANLMHDIVTGRSSPLG
jgi:hypothetical protein